MVTITHATPAVGTDAGTGEIHKAQWNEAHIVSGLISGSPNYARYETATEYTKTVGGYTDVDSTNMNFTLTTSGGPVLVTFHTALSMSALGARTDFTVSIDGTDQGGSDGIAKSEPEFSSGDHVVSFAYISAPLSAGSHTFKLRVKSTNTTWFGGAGTGTKSGTTHFGVYELAGGGSGGLDYDVSPSPTTYDDEFKTATLDAKWTTLGTLNTLNTTDFASRVHLVNNSSGGIVIDGAIYETAPATPFTVTVKLDDWLFGANYRSAGLLIGDGTKYATLFVAYTASYGYTWTLDAATWSNASTRTAVSEVNFTVFPIKYLRMVVTSGTNVDMYGSMDGLSWVPVVTGYNPGLGTVTRVGPYVQGNQSSTKSEGWFDWIRFGTNVLQSDALLWQNVGGSGAGAGTNPWLIELNPNLGSHGNTNWSTINIDAAELYAADLESSGAQNDEIYWDLGLPAGTWDLSLYHFKGANRGIYTVTLDGVSLGTIDGYNGSALRNQISMITGIAVSPGGKHRLKLAMATKNGSSSNYYGTINGVQLRRTAGSDPVSGSAGAILGVATYSTGSDSAWATVTSATATDIDATNAALAVIVPTSGKVVVEVDLDVGFNYSTFPWGPGYLCIKNGSTVLQSIPINFFTNAASNARYTTVGGRFRATFVLTGLTPGSMTLKAALRSDGTQTCYAFANDGAGGSGHYAGPFNMVVKAA